MSATTTQAAEGRRRICVVVACVVVLPVAMKLGYDFGSNLAGVPLGLAAAVNVAVLCALMIDAAVDRLVPAGRPQA
jgi:hypothetical protein